MSTNRPSPIPAIHLGIGVLMDSEVSKQRRLNVLYRSVNPATGEVLKTFAEHSDEEMMNALATADKAFVYGPQDHSVSALRSSAELRIFYWRESRNSLALLLWRWVSQLRKAGVKSNSAGRIMQYFADNAESFLRYARSMLQQYDIAGH